MAGKLSTPPIVEPLSREDRLEQVTMAHAELAGNLGDVAQAVKLSLQDLEALKADLERFKQIVLALHNAVQQLGGVVEAMATVRRV